MSNPNLTLTLTLFQMYYYVVSVIISQIYILSEIKPSFVLILCQGHFYFRMNLSPVKLNKANAQANFYLVFLTATSLTSLSLVNEAQYLMINRASVELLQKLMRNRFEHRNVSLKTFLAKRPLYTKAREHSLDQSKVWTHPHSHWSLTLNLSLVMYITKDDVPCVANNLLFPHPLFPRQGHSESDQLLDLRDVISRFRANLVVAGVEPFEEDDWSHLIIGNTQFMVIWHSEI